ncbi:hypothetical protein D3C81_2199130 [compost metagenome]
MLLVTEILQGVPGAVTSTVKLVVLLVTVIPEITPIAATRPVVIVVGVAETPEV